MRQHDDFHHSEAVPKQATLQFNNMEVNISFTASFETQLHHNATEERQLFSAFTGISSTLTDGAWTQIDYEPILNDDKTVYTIIVGGIYVQDGIESSHIIELTFLCNENGGIH